MEDFRLKRIEELKNQIFPLDKDRILYQAKLYMARHYGGFNESEIKETESLLSNINEILSPLRVELSTIQCNYYIEYEGELTNDDGTKSFQKNHKYLNLTTDYLIDTFKNGWASYTIGDSNIQSLLLEVFEKILLTFTHFRNLEIKRI